MGPIQVKWTKRCTVQGGQLELDKYCGPLTADSCPLSTLEQFALTQRNYWLGHVTNVHDLKKRTLKNTIKKNMICVATQKSFLIKC